MTGVTMRGTAWSAAALAMLAPVVAAQVSTEMNWTASDFVVWGMMLAAGLGAFELLTRAGNGGLYRLGAAMAVGTAFLLLWVSLAVGIIGSENNDANMMYAGVFATLTAGAITARGRPAGMAWTLVATAGVQAAIGAVALATNAGTDGAAWPRDVIGASTFFTLLWLAGAALFATAARGGASQRA